MKYKGGHRANRMTASARNWGDKAMVLSTPTIAWFAANLCPDASVMADPLASPLLADLSGMPPALFQVGTADPLLDDSLAMAARWTGAGGSPPMGARCRRCRPIRGSPT